MTTGQVSSASRRYLPRGVVTFLFTDIEGSTRLLGRLGDRYGDVLARHHALMRDCFSSHGGHEVDTEGDAFFVAFVSPAAAVAAAVDAQRALQAEPWPDGEHVRVRMGLHTGEAVVLEDGYVGLEVHRTARICSSGHGGQIVVSARVLDLVGDHLPDGVHARDLGSHWLKDLDEPEHLLQLDVDGLPTHFPPLSSQTPPTNVPQSVTTLVGRTQEKQELRELILDLGARLVTVTGPGGAGKTRIAAAVARELLDAFPHGVHFVDLSELRTADLVLPTVAGVLGVSLDGETGAGAMVARHIGDHRLLLVLDNVEQVVDAALEVASLLHECPRLHVLATSRILLGLAEEFEYPLPPMSLPQGTSVGQVEQSEAVQLFVARARLVRHDFAVTRDNAAAVGEVCRLLDGLPLAIQLAAARVRLFSPRALVDRLGDRLAMLTSSTRDIPERHRTIRAMIDWSYALLDAEERNFFRDFAIFGAGARLDSVPAVLSPYDDPIGLVTTLVNHSLLVQREDVDGQPRFRMLQTIRDYAMDLLTEDPEHYSAVAQRHAAHYLARAEQLMPPGERPQREAIEHVQADYVNVRAALALWLDDRRQHDPDAAANALRLAAVMGHYWYGHGQSMEGSAWLEKALARAPETPTPSTGLALLALGIMSEQRQELERASQLMARARGVFQQIGDRVGEARSLNGAGIVADSAGRADESLDLLRSAVSIFEEIGDVAGRTDALDSLGTAFLHQGDWEGARRIFRENLARDRALGNGWETACTALNLGLADLLSGDLDEARPRIREAMDAFTKWNDPNGVIETLEAAIGVAVATQQRITAARLTGAVDKTRASLGLRGSPPDRARVQDWAARVREELGPAAFDAAAAEGAAMTYEQAAGYARDEVLPA
ncbi:MAG: hypothetical protein QOK15_833 [Nocardioidaceae bacterium]|nr:hypothetical protein [Nocardioidaceae bacterium]